MAHVEGDLADVLAIGGHNVQVESPLLAAFLQAGVGAESAGFEVDFAGFLLPGGGKDNVAAGQVAGGDFVIDLGGVVIADERAKGVVFDIVFVQIPGVFNVVILIGIFPAHGKHQIEAVVGHIQIPEITVAGADASAQIFLRGIQSGAGLFDQPAAADKAYRIAQLIGGRCNASLNKKQRRTLRQWILIPRIGAPRQLIVAAAATEQQVAPQEQQEQGADAGSFQVHLEPGIQDITIHFFIPKCMARGGGTLFARLRSRQYVKFGTSYLAGSLD